MGTVPVDSTKPHQPSKPKRIPRNPDKAFELGFKIGSQVTKDEVRAEVLTYLEQRYMAGNAPARGTVGAQAILDVARDMSEYLGTL